MRKTLMTAAAAALLLSLPNRPAHSIETPGNDWSRPPAGRDQPSPEKSPDHEFEAKGGRSARDAFPVHYSPAALSGMERFHAARLKRLQERQSRMSAQMRAMGHPADYGLVPRLGKNDKVQVLPDGTLRGVLKAGDDPYTLSIEMGFDMTKKGKASGAYVDFRDGEEPTLVFSSLDRRGNIIGTVFVFPMGFFIDKHDD